MTTAFIPTFLSALQTVFDDRDCPVEIQSDFVTWTAVSALQEVIRRVAYLISEGESLDGRPPMDLEMVDLCLEQSLEIVERPRPVIEAIWVADSPLSRRERIWLLL